jgi:antitoxin FitA
MNTHIQIRNVPDSLHRKLKIRAAENNMTMTDYVKKLIERDVEKPTLREWAEQTAKLPATGLTTEDIVSALREDRDSH